MSGGTVSPLSNPAPADPLPASLAVVLIKQRKVPLGRSTYFIPAGTVIEICTLPAKTTYNPGIDATMIPVGTHKLGDVITPVPTVT